MAQYSRFAPWMNRVVLTAASLIFSMIGLRFIANPIGTSAARGMMLTTGLGATTARVGFGAIPLAVAVFCFACLLSPRRQRAGVSLVATLLATVIAVRLFGVAADGAAPESVRLFVPEAVILALSLGGLLLDEARPRVKTGGIA
jgi:hypothetical protein